MNDQMNEEEKRLLSFEDHAAIAATAAAWIRIQASMQEIQEKADFLKKSDDCSIIGYEIEKALYKHKPEKINAHVEGIIHQMNTTRCQVPKNPEQVATDANAAQ